MHATIDFRKHLIEIEKLVPLWRECTPRILVVTDSLDYAPGNAFGLTQFVSTLAQCTIHGMTPVIVKASRHNDPNADVQGFSFTHSAHGLVKSRYDVAFLLGFDSGPTLPPPEVDAIARFMQAGGGVFATGDHASLGAALCSEIPRVRSMRFWTAGAPSMADDKRLTTNLPGDDDVYEFDDQADVHPQRLFANYRTESGGIGNPHPLLQLPPPAVGAIEVFPDHPHEGECRIPANLATKFTLDAQSLDEWPAALGGGGAVSPEMVGLTVSHGDAFPGKDAVVPRAFMAIVAYDGQRAGVGRVVTDATWHHFVNVNLDGSGSPRSGLQSPPGTDTAALQRIRQYYVNLATWLMPQTTRRCRRFPWLYLELKRYPLFEELDLPPLGEATGRELRQVGVQVSEALATRVPRWQVEELVADALEDGIGAEKGRALRSLGARSERLSASEIGLAALGALTIASVERLPELVKLRELDPHAAFEPMAAEATRLGVRRYVESTRHELAQLDDLLHKVVQ